MRNEAGCFSALLILSMAISSSLALAVEPRSYGVYDKLGLIPYEEIRKPSPAVQKAVEFEKVGKWQEALAIYRSEFNKIIDLPKFDKSRIDEQIVVGYVRCAKRLRVAKTVYDAITKKERRHTLSSEIPRSFLLGLLQLGPDAVGNGESEGVGHLLRVKDVLPESFAVKFYLDTQKYDPSESRARLAALEKQYPGVEGVSYQRIRSHLQGYLGGEVYSNGKLVKRYGKEELPDREGALRMLRPFLTMPKPPSWAHYLAAHAHIGLKQKTEAKQQAELCRRRASGWQETIDAWMASLRKVKVID